MFKYEKKRFSMLTEEIDQKLQDMKRRSIVIYGLEAHVCIRQTALDLLEKDFDVTLVVDACSSMSHGDRNTGIESMKEAGVNLVTF